MAGAVLQGISIVQSKWPDSSIYVTQPHDLVEARLHRELLAAALAGTAYGYLAGQQSDIPGGYLRLDGDRIVEIVEKPPVANKPSDWVTIVAHFFRDHDVLSVAMRDEFQQEKTDAVYERALDRLMSQREFVMVRYAGKWQVLKYSWHVLDITAEILDRITTGDIDLGPDFVRKAPGVFVGRDVHLHSGAKLVAPVVVGHETVVGNNALVRESLVGNRCIVGFSSEVARSYVGDGCQLHANYVGDSVLDNNVLLGYGTVSANFRLDQQSVKSVVKDALVDTRRIKLGMIVGAGARVGVNSSIMPGVKIGPGELVGPGQPIFRDVRARTEE